MSGSTDPEMRELEISMKNVVLRGKFASFYLGIFPKIYRITKIKKSEISDFSENEILNFITEKIRLLEKNGENKELSEIRLEWAKCIFDTIKNWFIINADLKVKDTKLFPEINNKVNILSKLSFSEIPFSRKQVEYAKKNFLSDNKEIQAVLEKLF